MLNDIPKFQKFSRTANKLAFTLKPHNRNLIKFPKNLKESQRMLEKMKIISGSLKII